MTNSSDLQKRKKEAVAQQAAISQAVAKESAKYKPKGFIRETAEKAAGYGLVGAAALGALKYQKGKVKRGVDQALARGKAQAAKVKNDANFQVTKAKAAVGQVKDQSVDTVKKAAAPVVNEVNKGVARDAAAKAALKNTVTTQVSKGKAREAAAKAALSNKIKEFKSKASSPFKKKEKTNFSRSTQDIQFNKSVEVRGYRRKDGTIVRPSTRSVEVIEVQPQVPPEERLRNIGIALATLAGAASTGARAYNTVMGANTSRELANSRVRNEDLKTDRELSALGETRKFLGLTSGVGSGIRSTTSSFNDIRGFGSDLQIRKGELSLRHKALENKTASAFMDHKIKKGQLRLKQEQLNSQARNSEAYQSFVRTYAQSTRDKKEVSDYNYDLRLREWEAKNKKKGKK